MFFTEISFKYCEDIIYRRGIHRRSSKTKLQLKTKLQFNSSKFFFAFFFVKLSILTIVFHCSFLQKDDCVLMLLFWLEVVGYGWIRLYFCEKLINIISWFIINNYTQALRCNPGFHTPSRMKWIDPLAERLMWGKLIN